MPRCLTLLAAAGTAAAVSAASAGVEIPQFSNQTDAVGLTFEHTTLSFPRSDRHMMTPGVAVGDLDRDGWLDVIVQGGLGQMTSVFMNNGDGTFTDQAAAWGLAQTLYDASSAALADIDGDGDLDFYSGTVDARNLFYVNTGSTFVEQGFAMGGVLTDGEAFDGFGVSFGDIDLDGDLDLATSHWAAVFTNGNLLFRNNGDLTFTDITTDAGLYTEQDMIWGFTPALVDLNGDRYPELAVTADFGVSEYNVNNGDSTFTRVTDNGCCTDENGMGAAFGDYDNDGDLDWFVTSIFDVDGFAEGNWGITGNRLYRNDGNDQFTDVTEETGVRIGYWGWGTEFADFNHDGLLDIAMTNGFLNGLFLNRDPVFIDDPSRLWLNTGRPGGSSEPVFVERSAKAGLAHTAAGKALVAFDADHDGDLDVLITTNHGALAYFENEFDPSPQQWIEIDLVAPPGNAPDGIGAIIRLTTGGTTIMRPMIGAPSFLSHGPLRAHFGFPAVETIERIEVEWPDGTSKVLHDVAPGRVLRIIRGDVDADGSVGPFDLSVLLDTWGNCPPGPATCPADLDGDGVVGPIDLSILLDDWS